MKTKLLIALCTVFILTNRAYSQEPEPKPPACGLKNTTYFTMQDDPANPGGPQQKGPEKVNLKVIRNTNNDDTWTLDGKVEGGHKIHASGVFFNTHKSECALTVLIGEVTISDHDSCLYSMVLVGYDDWNGLIGHMVPNNQDNQCAKTAMSEQRILTHNGQVHFVQ